MDAANPQEEKRQDDSLGNLMPEPVRDDDRPSIGMLQGGLIVCGVLGGALLLVEGTTTRTMGATRSAKLKWQQRQVEIDQAQQNVRINYDEDN